MENGRRLRLRVAPRSVFSKRYHIRCKKGCLTLGETGWMPSSMMPWYALLADGVSYRPVARLDSSSLEGAPKDDMPRAG